MALLKLKNYKVTNESPHPLELLQAIIHCDNSEISSEMLSFLLGIDLGSQARNFIFNFEYFARMMVKSAENCYLGIIIKNDNKL